MTGFGAGHARADGREARVELRSVNHRHLHVKVRLPADLAALEPEVEAAVRARLARGSVTVGVGVERSGGAGLATIDREAARRYLSMLGGLATELGLPERPSLAMLVSLPGVVGLAQDEEQHERESALVLEALASALEALVEMREHEGRELAADLRRNARAVAGLVGRVEERMPEVVRGHQAALQQRVGELLGGRQPVAPGDLARELALLADRMDVGEELARLKSHLAQLERVLAQGGSVGRQLDFLTQELFREANTIGSKCNDAPVAHMVVEMKTHVERLREQVQNVE
jgi:uncharacterized protein (TIGR00255 family)